MPPIFQAFDNFYTLTKGTHILIKLLKALLGLFIVIVASLAVFLFYMRYHDGPMEIFTGGPFQTGTFVTEKDGNKLDLPNLVDRATFEFQLEQPARSRTVWLAVHDNRLFIASAYMNESYAKIWKQWPHQIAKDNRVLLRIDGKIYQRQLNRIFDPAIAVAVGMETERKYGMNFGQSEVDAEDVWLFEVIERD